MFLALQRTTVPEQFGVVLVIEPDGNFDTGAAVQLLATRIRAVPRLRQRIVRVPPGCGRPVWVDDPTFAVDGHLDAEACPPPGDEAAMLAAAAELLVRPLRVDRPLWAARFITGLAGGQVALVVVVQHALADGLGGLAVLGALLDGAPPPVDRPFPIPAPTRTELVTDVFATSVRTLARLPGLRCRPSRSPEPVRPARIGRAAACSLLAPTGPRRRVAVARADLEAIRATAHVRGATVNDALVSAIAGAMHACLDRRGEDPPPFVIAVPVAVRRGTTATDPGNAFTEARAAVSGGGDPGQRLADVAAVMRRRKESAMQPATLSVAAVAVRAMVASGAYGWYMRRQRYLHTVMTNLRGPEQSVALNGAPITGMLPLAVGGGGNVTVTFAALSYAGTLAVTVTADPDVTPDLPLLTAELQTQLDLLHG
jgi:diacylglycerol O-acyltransferase / wax synthase